MIWTNQPIDKSRVNNANLSAKNLITYIQCLPAPLNLKCITDLLNADPLDPNDKWGIVINAVTSTSNNTAQMNSSKFLEQLYKILIKENTNYYHDIMSPMYKEDLSFSAQETPFESHFMIDAEFITALKYEEFIEDLSNIFSLL